MTKEVQSEQELFRQELTELYEKRKMRGIVLVIEGEKVHFSRCGLGEGISVDCLKSVHQTILQGLLVANELKKT